jgi:putative hydrolase of the HAD superfamily
MAEQEKQENKYQAVIFDYGNVLCLPQSEADSKQLAARLDLAPDRFSEAYWKYRDAYDLAELSDKEYWTKVVQYARRPKLVSPDLLSDQLIDEITILDNASWAHPNELTLEIVHALKKLGMTIAILSNMPYSMRHYLDRCKWLPAFDHHTFSCELGVMKPAAKIYEHCISGLGVPSNTVLFVDDRTENVNASRALGIESIVFTTPQNLAEMLIAKLPNAFTEILKNWLVKPVSRS